MQLPSSVVILALSLIVSEIRPVFHWKRTIHSTPNLKTFSWPAFPKFCARRAATKS